MGDRRPPRSGSPGAATGRSGTAASSARPRRAAMPPGTTGRPRASAPVTEPRPTGAMAARSDGGRRPAKRAAVTAPATRPQRRRRAGTGPCGAGPRAGAPRSRPHGSAARRSGRARRGARGPRARGRIWREARRPRGRRGRPSRAPGSARGPGVRDPSASPPSSSSMTPRTRIWSEAPGSQTCSAARGSARSCATLAEAASACRSSVPAPRSAARSTIPRADLGAVGARRRERRGPRCGGRVRNPRLDPRPGEVQERGEVGRCAHVGACPPLPTTLSDSRLQGTVP